MKARYSVLGPKVIVGIILPVFWGSLCAQQPHPAVSEGGGSYAAQSSLPEYHARVGQLRGVIEGCLAAHTAEACDSSNVGPDLRVDTPAGVRTVHFAWLRETLAAGRQPGPASEEALHGARDRLAQQWQTAAARETESDPPTDAVRRRLTNVLARSEFRHIQDPGLLARAQQAVWKWIFDRLQNLAAFGGTNRWLGTLLKALAIGLPCVLLLIWVIRRLAVPEPLDPPPAAGDLTAPSARPWQRWLSEAAANAAGEHWREAVQCLYWAAISRLEASGMWSADVARTPREYLALLGAEHPSRRDLRELTRSFERIWYGNRPAQSPDYDAARALVEKLRPR